MDRIERASLTLSILLRASLVVAAVLDIVQGRWSDLFILALTLFLTFIPAILQGRIRLTLPNEFELIFVAFVYAGNFLGGIHGFYYRISWWDIALHFTSGLNLGLIGFASLYVLIQQERVRAGPFLVAVFSFSFALALGALWEIFEFGMDSLFGLNMQKSGLVDTMWDLIVDTVAALIASFSGYLYLTRGKGWFVHRMLARLFRKNPHLRGPDREESFPNDESQPRDPEQTDFE